MAGFRTHVTVSSAIGAGYAVVASGMGYSLSTSLVAGGLCGVSGMLPDVDSDSGVPRRESLGFAAAIVPMLMIDRFKQLDLGHDQMVLIGASLYFGIRFLAAKLIGKWSVHRGMWHSIPAVLIFAGLAFLISGSTEIMDRYLKAVAVGLGAMSHLVLDEIYSIDTRGVVPRFKKSFGTAIKFFGKDRWANFSVYAKLAVVAGLISIEPMVISRLSVRNPELAAKLQKAADRVDSLEGRLAQRTDAITGRTASGDAEPQPIAAAQQQPAQQQPAQQRPTQQQPAQQQYAPQQYAPPMYSQQPTTPPSWFAPPGTGGGGFAPNRSDASQEGGPFTR
ncbi:hypothetical protein Pla108_21000 [Botrimarina colliarenosi]|uniref:Inner membrane protein n=1 Tax=Botrimarina colliarenosi TaxID=2528001 RepID=A0A5C6AFI3_9BACT|nr:metal-dependent hydrolase [Botrimarina colliarenosi]TWT97945.1 hypothetical protein Pla108_21000 [Botrimarina colliarenosi]